MPGQLRTSTRLFQASGVISDLISGSVLGHVWQADIRSSRSALSSAGFFFTRSKSSRRPSSSNSRVAMEVIVQGYWNPFSDIISNAFCNVQYGKCCVVSPFYAAVQCNVNDTVEDAYKMVNTNCSKRVKRSLGPEKIIAPPSNIITANVYYNYGWFIIHDFYNIHMEPGCTNFVENIVDPQHEVINLTPNTKLWRAKEMFDEKLRSLKEDVDGSGSNANVPDMIQECNDHLGSHIIPAATSENRIWFPFGCK